MGARQDPLKEMTTLSHRLWNKVTAAAEKYNEPGRFTAFIGYEWTSMPGGDNLHRNVIFRDGKDKADPIVPFLHRTTASIPKICGSGWPTTSRRPAAVCWRSRTTATSPTASCSTTSTLHDQKPLDRDYAAATRASGNRFYEVTQIEGRWRDAPVALAERRVRQLSSSGTRASFGHVAQDT